MLWEAATAPIPRTDSQLFTVLHPQAGPSLSQTQVPKSPCAQVPLTQGPRLQWGRHLAPATRRADGQFQGMGEGA